MWEIFYEDKCETFDNTDEALDCIKNLHLEYQNKQPQFMGIQLKKVGYIEIGIGDKLNRSMIFYHPKDISKDCKISFNPSIDIEDNTKVDIFAPSEAFHYLLERNIIDFDDVINEVEFFLNNKEISSKANMYCW